MNDWSVYSNNWNGVFFIFGNRYLYFLLIVPVFLICLYDLANEGNLRYCAVRLHTKATILKVQIMAMIFLSVFLTIYVFGVVIIEAFLVLGGRSEWSKETELGFDPYTLFFLDFSPIIVISLFAVKFFVTLFFIGSFYLYWQSITKRKFRSLGMSINYFLLLFNAIVNLYNIPILKILDLSLVSIYYLNPHENRIFLHSFISYVPFIILSISFLFFSVRLSKGVNL
jgi:hypothetical protein